MVTWDPKLPEYLLQVVPIIKPPTPDPDDAEVWIGGILGDSGIGGEFASQPWMAVYRPAKDDTFWWTTKKKTMIVGNLTNHCGM